MPNETAMHGYGTGLFVYDYTTSDGDLNAAFVASGGNLSTGTGGDGELMYAAMAGETEIDQIIEASGDGINVSMAETSHLKSPGRWREFVPGFRDGQTATIQVNYTEASYAALIARVPQANVTPPSWGRYIWGFDYPDGAYSFQVGAIQTLGLPRAADDRMVVDVTIKFSGPCYFFTTS